MKDNISISDFTIRFVGYSNYKVTYKSKKRKTEWKKTINYSYLIDSVRKDNPKKKDLITLKRIIKRKL